eukprot:TRINITY_DN2248_c0_g1_i1.p1 TRINITY_DN2248_c0_g1~~TRINITY_DN2248_c0_g1_i1.p1  ORF type:complete len:154 (+),score=16.75 TRINITY_DN2248_c0_g1_i1:215-676(+)
MQMRVLLFGRPETCYADGQFELSVSIPDTYPFQPPKITCLTPVYHPQFGEDGVICLGILIHTWSPALTLERTFFALNSMLHDPDVEQLDRVNHQAGQDLCSDALLFSMKARRMTLQYATAHLPVVQDLEQQPIDWRAAFRFEISRAFTSGKRR